MKKELLISMHHPPVQRFGLSSVRPLGKQTVPRWRGASPPVGSLPPALHIVSRNQPSKTNMNTYNELSSNLRGTLTTCYTQMKI